MRFIALPQQVGEPVTRVHLNQRLHQQWISARAGTDAASRFLRG